MIKAFAVCVFPCLANPLRRNESAVKGGALIKYSRSVHYDAPFISPLDGGVSGKSSKVEKEFKE
jgi:hypothetical protein